MLIIFITLITIAIPLQSLTYTRWARLGFISLLLALFIAINSTPLILDSSFEIMNTLSLYNGLLVTTLVTNTIDVVLLLVATMLLSPYSHIIHVSDGNNNMGDMLQKAQGMVAKNEYILLTFCTLLGSIILIGANDLLTLLLGIELQSYSLYLIASTSQYPANTGINEPSEAAGLKYYLLGALASALILLGIAILYGVTGSTCIPTITELMVFKSSNSILGVGGTIEPSAILGITLILIGIVWKFAGAPLHNWAVDVYDAIPTFSAAWLATIPKVALLTIMSEILFLVPYSAQEGTLMTGEDLYFFQSLSPIWFILLVSVLSMVIGSIGALTQPLMKRLLAYSSIGQLGFILLGISLGTQGTVVFYLAQYTMTNAAIWLCLLITPLYNRDQRVHRVHNNSHGAPIIPNLSIKSEIRNITELQGIHINNIYIALAYTVLFFSLAGIPPMVGFFAKLEIISASLTNGSLGVVISIIAILSSLISAAYYLRVIRAIFFSSIQWHKKENKGGQWPMGLSLNQPAMVGSSVPSVYILKNIAMKVKKQNEELGEDLNRNITYTSALIISFVTLMVTLFILQGNVVLIWCNLMTM